MEFRNALARKSLRDKLMAYFATPPCPGAVFHLSATNWSGMSVSVREKKIRSHSVLALNPGLVEPHFDKKNIKDRAALAGVIKKDLARMPYSGETAACLLPEPCLKVFVFAFESLPQSEREKTKLFLWRVKKQLPLLAEDIRLAYQVMNANASVRVLVCLARAAVLAEYESVFAAAGIKVGIITTPTLSLLNLVDWDKEKDFILVNVEADSTSLVAVSESQLSLFRLKPNPVDDAAPAFDRPMIENVITEIENTTHFLEDREKRNLSSLWLHSSSAEFLAGVRAELSQRLPFAVKEFNLPFAVGGWSASERALLAPLFGQIL